MTTYTTADDSHSMIDPLAGVYEEWIPAATLIRCDIPELPTPPKAYKRADWYEVADE